MFVDLSVKQMYVLMLKLSNRLGSAKCAADLVLPAVVARSGEQAIAIEGRSTLDRLVIYIQLCLS